MIMIMMIAFERIADNFDFTTQGGLQQTKTIELRKKKSMTATLFKSPHVVIHKLLTKTNYSAIFKDKYFIHGIAHPR